MSVRTITILALAALSAAPVAAQRGRSPARVGATAETTLRLRERLQLSEEQQNQLRAIRKEDVARRRTTSEAFRQQMRAQREEIRALNVERGDRVRGVLNETQRGQLNQFRQQQARRQFRQSSGRGGRMGAQASRGARVGMGGAVRGQAPRKFQNRARGQGRGQDQRGRMRRPPAGTGEPIGN